MRIKCIVTYDGSAYYGWQSQPFVVSIQDAIEDALKTIHKHDVSITGSGRTDRGVHALGQVFHFDTDLSLTEDKWVKAINANLASDIRILSAEIVSDSFHARFDAKKKQYDYYLNIGEYNVFERNYVTQYNQDLNIDLMKEISTVFIGEHDFTSFCGNSLEETPDQIRNIETIDISEKDKIVHIKFVGNGFLRYMVRMIVGVLIEAGKGKITKDEVSEILDLKSKDACRLKANSEGLYLTKVFY